VIWTTKDPSGPVDEGRRIAALLPQGEFAVIENAGHWPQFEKAEDFNRIHIDFLRRKL
jgi:2-hydroxy-6-oxonona-2,4-dienedioate hydrolase